MKINELEIEIEIDVELSFVTIAFVMASLSNYYQIVVFVENAKIVVTVAETVIVIVVIILFAIMIATVMIASVEQKIGRTTI